MRRLAGWRSVWPSVRVPLALVIGVLTTPSAARATCGDYLMYGGSHPAAASSPSAATATHEALPRSPSLPTHGRTPCSGLFCGQGKPLVPATPAPRVTGGGQEWGCTAATDASVAPGAATPFRDVVSALPIRRAGVIYHPPRPSLSQFGL
jgi:hypothetical protein